MKLKGVVELYDTVNKTTQSFQMSHANAIMSMKDNGGWIVKSEKMIYTKEYGIINKSDSRILRKAYK